MVGEEGGRREFALGSSERVYYWWRGSGPPSGVRLREPADGGRTSAALVGV
jgi:hypothetical protein